MKSVYWIVRRELLAYLRSPSGWIIIATILFLDGLCFHAFVMGNGSKRSAEVISEFFFWSSGWTMVASLFFSMRLVAEERQTGTWVLLATAPIRDWQVVLGKFLSAFSFLALLLALTIYMPILVMVNGKVSLGHVVAGYLGLLLLNAAAIGICLLCSALAPNQLVAAILGGASLCVLIVLWLLSRIASPPLEDLIAYLSIHDKHFRPFMRGLVSIQDVVFYVSLTFVALVLTTRVLEARRWR